VQTRIVTPTAAPPRSGDLMRRSGGESVSDALPRGKINPVAVDGCRTCPSSSMKCIRSGTWYNGGCRLARGCGIRTRMKLFLMTIAFVILGTMICGLIVDLAPASAFGAVGTVGGAKQQLDAVVSLDTLQSAKMNPAAALNWTGIHCQDRGGCIRPTPAPETSPRRPVTTGG
jgi:hypothetical protein